MGSCRRKRGWDGRPRRPLHHSSHRLVGTGCCSHPPRRGLPQEHAKQCASPSSCLIPRAPQMALNLTEWWINISFTAHKAELPATASLDVMSSSRDPWERLEWALLYPSCQSSRCQGGSSAVNLLPTIPAVAEIPSSMSRFYSNAPSRRRTDGSGVGCPRDGFLPPPPASPGRGSFHSGG